jgi:hypothetical protein
LRNYFDDQTRAAGNVLPSSAKKGQKTFIDQPFPGCHILRACPTAFAPPLASLVHNFPHASVAFGILYLPPRFRRGVPSIHPAMEPIGVEINKKAAGTRLITQYRHKQGQPSGERQRIQGRPGRRKATP